MKAIKYRAWHKKLEKYLEVGEFFFSAKSGVLYLVKCWNENQLINCYVDEIYGVAKNIILEQFTGLYDKNGKEIYSGDIVEIVYGKRKWKYVIATEWEGYYGIFQLLFYVNFREDFDGDVIFGDFYFEVGETHSDFVFVTGSKYEVIGNIHENKELLSAK